MTQLPVSSNGGNGNGGLQQPAPIQISWQGFRVPSQDQHGHSERIWFRLQPGHAGQVRRIVGLKVWPYRETGDFLRHAVDRHIKWLESQAPIPSVTRQVDAILEVLREEEFQADYRTVFDKLATQVSVYVGMGADGEARGLVNRVKIYIEDMPRGPWRQRYLTELDTKFGYLIQNARGVALGGSNWDPNTDGTND